MTDTELIVLEKRGESRPLNAVTSENGKKTHRSKSCYGSHGNRGGVNGLRFAFRPSVHSGQSWTFAPRWTKSKKDRICTFLSLLILGMDAEGHSEKKI